MVENIKIWTVVENRRLVVSDYGMADTYNEDRLNIYVDCTMRMDDKPFY